MNNQNNSMNNQNYNNMNSQNNFINNQNIFKRKIFLLKLPFSLNLNISFFFNDS